MGRQLQIHRADGFRIEYDLNRFVSLRHVPNGQLITCLGLIFEDLVGVIR